MSNDSNMSMDSGNVSTTTTTNSAPVEINSTPVSTAAPAVETSATPTAPVSFLDSLPAELRGEPCLSTFKQPEDLVKSYINAQKMIGSSVRMPAPDASPEEKRAFYEKLKGMPEVAILPDPNDTQSLHDFWGRLGRPADPNEYKINLPENRNIDETALGGFKQVAHDLGLNNAQADALVQFELQRENQRLASFNQEKTKTTELLKERWGNNYDNKMKSVRELVSKYGDQYADQVQELINSSAGNNPVVLMMAAELAATYKENQSISGSGAGISTMDVTPEQARTIINTIRRDPTDALNNSGHRDHKARVEYLYQLECLAGLTDR